MTTESEQKITQFHNNFYMLFLALLLPNAEAIDSVVLLEKAQKDESWKHFLESNTDLLSRLTPALENLKAYLGLAIQFNELNKKRRYDEADAFDEEHGLDQLRYTVWRALNPLLEEAYTLMAESGMDPDDYAG